MLIWVRTLRRRGGTLGRLTVGLVGVGLLALFVGPLLWLGHSLSGSWLVALAGAGIALAHLPLLAALVAGPLVAGPLGLAPSLRGAVARFGALPLVAIAMIVVAVRFWGAEEAS